uniref:Uncharacterized protein n=1 Tax=uncultured marine virus TaxID=186617 RepID=A0A0F7L8W3_9VIRU|nr:hypothetical protein [uncultured marine virus]
MLLLHAQCVLNLAQSAGEAGDCRTVRWGLHALILQSDDDTGTLGVLLTTEPRAVAVILGDDPRHQASSSGCSPDRACCCTCTMSSIRAMRSDSQPLGIYPLTPSIFACASMRSSVASCSHSAGMTRPRATASAHSRM